MLSVLFKKSKQKNQNQKTNKKKTATKKTSDIVCIVIYIILLLIIISISTSEAVGEFLRKSCISLAFYFFFISSYYWIQFPYWCEHFLSFAVPHRIIQNSEAKRNLSKARSCRATALHRPALVGWLFFLRSCTWRGSGVCRGNRETVQCSGFSCRLAHMDRIPLSCFYSLQPSVCQFQDFHRARC